MPLRLLGLILGVIAAGASPSWAGPSVRVAVLQNSASVTVTGNGISLALPDGARILDPGLPKVVIVPDPDGVSVNGRHLRAAEVVATGANGVVAVNGLELQGGVHVKLRPGGLLVVNELDVEDYLRGVVPLEISSNWHPEALKVQAIIARTYALYQRLSARGRDFDLAATTQDQVYGGRAHYQPASDAAVAETRGQILEYKGNIVFAAYHSTSAGATEDAREVWGLDLDYLRGVSCPFDSGSPYFRWAKALPMERLQQGLEAIGFHIGTIATITPLSWTAAGRVSRVRMLHSDGELILKGEELRRIVGFTELPSTNFSIVRLGSQIQVEGQGAGHAVGLCQWGAKTMAEMGYVSDQILGYYYPGVTLGQVADFF